VYNEEHQKESKELEGGQSTMISNKSNRKIGTFPLEEILLVGAKAAPTT